MLTLQEYSQWVIVILKYQRVTTEHIMGNRRPYGYSTGKISKGKNSGLDD